jgi:23S rRNA U2552 (ribose-2'-O)-methylase RlmE/FtsJ
MARDRRDSYYWQAKSDGYRSRASFKLTQINKKFEVITEGDTIVDLGAAPGRRSIRNSRLSRKVIRSLILEQLRVDGSRSQKDCQAGVLLVLT